MSKPIIRKIAFVLVFTFFFQVNSGLIFALSNENNNITETVKKISFQEIQDKITELLKYNYIYENSKNRNNIQKLLALSFIEVSLKIDFKNNEITLSNKDNITYSFKNNEIINDFIIYLNLDSISTKGLASTCGRWIIKQIPKLFEVIKDGVKFEVIKMVAIKIWESIPCPINNHNSNNDDDSHTIPSYNGHDTNPSTGGIIYREY